MPRRRIPSRFLFAWMCSSVGNPFVLFRGGLRGPDISIFRRWRLAASVRGDHRAANSPRVDAVGIEFDEADAGEPVCGVTGKDRGDESGAVNSDWVDAGSDAFGIAGQGRLFAAGTGGDGYLRGDHLPLPAVILDLNGRTCPGSVAPLLAIATRATS